MKEQRPSEKGIEEMCKRLGLRLWPTWEQNIDRLLPALREYDKNREPAVLFMLPVGLIEN